MRKIVKFGRAIIVCRSASDGNLHDMSFTGLEGRIRTAADPQTRQFAHPSVITVLTPAGKVSRYFAGIE
jgi:hypothetical protein